MKCRIKHPKQRSPGIRLRWRPENGPLIFKMGAGCPKWAMVTHMVKTVNTW